jgi:hypothetical protein
MQVNVRDLTFTFDDSDNDKLVVSVDSEDTDIERFRAILSEYTQRIVRSKTTVAAVVDKASVDTIVKRLEEEGKVQIPVQI